jgi:flagellar protein FlaG
MSATPFVPDVSTPVARGNPANRREEGDVQTRVQTVVAKEDEEGRSEKKVEPNYPPKSITNINLLGSGLEFAQDQETGLTIIKMYDRETGKLVRQLPPEETLAFLRRLVEDKKGVLVSKKL